MTAAFDPSLGHLPGGRAVLGEVQCLPGYCLLIVDKPDVYTLDDLDQEEQREFLARMARLSSAVARACRSLDPRFRRMNLEILGNTEPHLHAHLWPRYEWEPEERVTGPVWLYQQEFWTDPQHRVGLPHEPLRQAILHELANSP